MWVAGLPLEAAAAELLLLHLLLDLPGLAHGVLLLCLLRLLKLQLLLLLLGALGLQLLLLHLLGLLCLRRRTLL